MMGTMWAKLRWRWQGWRHRLRRWVVTRSPWLSKKRFQEELRAKAATHRAARATERRKYDDQIAPMLRRLNHAINFAYMEPPPPVGSRAWRFVIELDEAMTRRMFEHGNDDFAITYLGEHIGYLAGDMLRKGNWRRPESRRDPYARLP